MPMANPSPDTERNKSRRCALNFIDLQDFIAIVIDDFDGDLARLRFVESAADSRVKALPGSFVYLSPQGALQFLVRVIGPCEVSVAHKEAFAVVVGVDKPAGNVVGGAVSDLD